MAPADSAAGAAAGAGGTGVPTGVVGDPPAATPDAPPEPGPGPTAGLEPEPMAGPEPVPVPVAGLAPEPEAGPAPEPELEPGTGPTPTLPPLLAGCVPTGFPGEEISPVQAKERSGTNNEKAPRTLLLEKVTMICPLLRSAAQNRELAAVLGLAKGLGWHA
jgi:hypothetical protein